MATSRQACHRLETRSRLLKLVDIIHSSSKKQMISWRKSSYSNSQSRAVRTLSTCNRGVTQNRLKVRRMAKMVTLRSCTRRVQSPNQARDTNLWAKSSAAWPSIPPSMRTASTIHRVHLKVEPMAPLVTSRRSLTTLWTCQACKESRRVDQRQQATRPNRSITLRQTV